jgi:hypothetical protein
VARACEVGSRFANRALFSVNARGSARCPYLTNLFIMTVVRYWVAFVYHFFLASEISMLGTSIPLVMNFAKSSGMSPLLLGMI